VKCKKNWIVESYQPYVRFDYCETCIRALIRKDQAALTPADEKEKE